MPGSLQVSGKGGRHGSIQGWKGHELHDDVQLPSAGQGPEPEGKRPAFSVPVTEAGQLELTLNGAPIDYTVVGRSTRTSDITGLFLITTTTENSVLTVRNPAGNQAALTITPLAGGTNPVSAHLVITQIS